MVGGVCCEDSFLPHDRQVAATTYINAAIFEDGNSSTALRLDVEVVTKSSDEYNLYLPVFSVQSRCCDYSRKVGPIKWQPYNGAQQTFVGGAWLNVPWTPKSTRARKQANASLSLRTVLFATASASRDLSL